MHSYKNVLAPFTKRTGTILFMAFLAAMLVFVAGSVFTPNSADAAGPAVTDNQAPEAQFTSPNAGSSVNLDNPLSVTGTFTEEGSSGISRINLYVSKGDNYSYGNHIGRFIANIDDNGNTGTFSYSFSPAQLHNLSGVNPGDQITVTAVPIDEAGNGTATRVNLTLMVAGSPAPVQDTEDPTVTFTSPSGTVDTTAPFTISGIYTEHGDSGISRIQLYISKGGHYQFGADNHIGYLTANLPNKPTASDGATGQFTYTLSQSQVNELSSKLGIGPGDMFTITAIAIDNAGNGQRSNDDWADSSPVFYAAPQTPEDTTAPTITVKDSSVGDRGTKVFSNVSFKLHDTNMLDKYVLNGHTDDFTNNAWSDANFQNIKPYLNVGPGNTITVYDVAGNSTSYTFTYDPNYPESGNNPDTVAPDISILEPTSNDSTTAGVTVSNDTSFVLSGTATDSVSSVGRVSVKITDLNTHQTVFGPKNHVNVTNGNWSVTVPANTLPEGDQMQVIAFGRDQAGNGADDHAYFIVGSPAPAPLAITGLRIMQDGNNISGQTTNEQAITVQWDAINNPNFDHFEYHNRAGWHNVGSQSMFHGLIGDSHVNNGVYIYEVYAVGKDGSHSATESVSVTYQSAPTPPAAPSAPTDLYLMYGNLGPHYTDGESTDRSSQSGTWHLNWTNTIAASNTAEYMIKRTYPDGHTSHYTILPGQEYTPLYHFSNEGYGDYTYQIRVKDDSGNWSAYSSPITVSFVSENNSGTNDPNTPEAPTNLYLTYGVSSSANHLTDGEKTSTSSDSGTWHLNWSKTINNSDIEAYRIDRSYPNGSPSVAYTILPSSNPTPLYHFTQEGTGSYTYAIQVENEEGVWSPYSNEITVNYVTSSTSTNSLEVTGLRIMQDGNNVSGQTTSDRLAKIVWDPISNPNFDYFEYHNASGWMNVGSHTSYPYTGYGYIGGANGADGTYTYEVRAVSDNGSTSPAVSVSVTLDTSNSGNGNGGGNNNPSLDANNDGFISTVEGQPAYGMVKTSLTTTGDTSASSALALGRFPVASDTGVISYFRSFSVPATVADSITDGNVVVVQHGIDINNDGSYDGNKDSQLNPSVPFEATVPTDCGVLQSVGNGYFIANLSELNSTGSHGITFVHLSGDQASVNIYSSGLSPDLAHAQHFHIGGNHICPANTIGVLQ